MSTYIAESAALSLRSNGSEQRIFPRPNDSYLIELLGNTVIILFPTDNPAGPSTTLVSGRVVFTIDNAGVFTLLTIDGHTTDICAAL